jgi:nucleoside-diphosphate-sugar epimerase
MKNTILIGPSGFWGPAILKNFPSIIAVGRKKPPFYCKNKFIKILNIHNLKKLEKIRIDYVIYLVGNSNHHNLNKSNLKKSLELNVSPLQSALNYFSKRKIKKFISFTGALLYDERKLKIPCKENSPINPYKNNYIFSKFLAEKVTEYYSNLVPSINVRLSNIYGPSMLNRPDIIISIFNNILKKNKEIKVHTFKPERDFVHTDDVSKAIIKLLKSNFTGTVNLGSGEKNSIKKVCNIIEKITNHKIKSKNIKVNGPYKYQHNISLLKKIIKWKPEISLKNGLKLTWEQMLNWQRS